jgi:hypothetical protein
VDFDFNEILDKIKTWFNKTFEKIEAYFKSLTQYEMYAWIAFALGFVLVLVALITW